MKKQPVEKIRSGAAYIRVSTEEQAELSPESQLEEIKKYAEREGIELLEDNIYIDYGISGRKAEKRPQFMKMIARAKKKDCPFSVVLLWKFSRFARNQEESIFYKSILRSKCGIDVVSITEPLMTGPFGNLIERIIEWMDEFYSIRLSQEVKRSMTVNAERGKLQCAAPFGYMAKNGMLVPKPEETCYVQQIFDGYAAGNSISSIVRRLNDLGVKTHRGNRFENRSVEYILQNPVYIGKLRWNPDGPTCRKYLDEKIIVAQGSHAPLISAEIWEKAQRRMREVKQQYPPKTRPVSEHRQWISGMVRCAACGATLVFSKPHYYKCNNYVRGRCTHSQHIRADILEEAIVDQLKNDAAASLELTYDILDGDVDNKQSILQMETSLRQLKSKKERLQEAYLAGVVDLSAFSRAKKELEGNEICTAKELAAYRLQKNDDTGKEIIQNAAITAIKVFQCPTATVEEKNRAARSVIETCIFDKENATLSITYRITL